MSLKICNEKLKSKYNKALQRTFDIHPSMDDAIKIETIS